MKEIAVFTKVVFSKTGNLNTNLKIVEKPLYSKQLLKEAVFCFVLCPF